MTSIQLFTMHRSMFYDYWKQDSQLYQQVEASAAERLQGATEYGQSAFQPHQIFLHSIQENSHGNFPPVIPQYHVSYGGTSTTDDQTLIPRDDVLDAGITQGNIQSCAAGLHPRHWDDPSSYPPHAFSDYLSAHNMGFSDTTLVDSWTITPMQGFQHDACHQFQEDVYPHPRYVVNDDESELHVVGRACKWNDGYGICGRTIIAARTGEHMLSCHFKSPLSANSRLKCMWQDCQLHKSVRRDTIIRHIEEKHLGLKYRCKSWVASHDGADFYGSRKNTRLHS